MCLDLALGIVIDTWVFVYRRKHTHGQGKCKVLVTAPLFTQSSGLAGWILETVQDWWSWEADKAGFVS